MKRKRISFLVSLHSQLYVDPYCWSYNMKIAFVTKFLEKNLLILNIMTVALVVIRYVSKVILGDGQTFNATGCPLRFISASYLRISCQCYITFMGSVFNNI